MCQDRVEFDARRLLHTFTTNGDCDVFLSSLPSYITEGSDVITLRTCNRVPERNIHAVCNEHINSTAALDVLPFFGDSAYYPLVVLARALMLAHGFPPAFFIDAVYSLCGSILNKQLYVQLGQYKSKSRQWSTGVAAAGQGKSPTVKPLVSILQQVLQEHESLAPGDAADNFHMCQSTTTAAAIEKLRSTAAYLLCHSDDSGRCLSLTFAAGGRTDKGEHMDATYFLDAAHSDEFSHQTCRDRDRRLRRKL